MPGSVLPFARCYHDLDVVVDEIHALFATWADRGTIADTLDDFGLYVMQLAVHEWIANIVQHASFDARTPEIAVAIAVEDGGLRCVIEDNSDGFDFQQQVGRQQALASGPEPSERGRGLLMLIACTEDLLYEQAEPGRQRLGFVIRPPVTADELVPLFQMTRAFDEPMRGGYPTEPAP